MERRLRDLLGFVRRRTTLSPTPFVPEVSIHQAVELTSLWHAAAKAVPDWAGSPFWAFPWAGGQALARYLVDNPKAARGRSVLDFGAGSGLVGIAAARAGAARIVAWDPDPFSEPAVLLNARANGVRVEFRAGSPFSSEVVDTDLVVAGDVFYEPELSRNFVLFARALAGRGVRVLAGDPGRLYSATEGVKELAAYDVPTSLELESRAILRARVLEILP